MKTKKMVSYRTIMTFFLSLTLLLQLGVASVSAWDVSAKFDITHCNKFYPFSSTAGNLGQIYTAELDSTSDDLYTEVYGLECCLEGGCRDYWGSPELVRMGPWVVERKYVDDNTYRILIRGASKADCSCGGNGYVKGEVIINPDSGWKITSIIKNSVNNDNKGKAVYCNIDMDTGEIEFAGGSTCGGCCCCIDSGQIDIEVVVERGQGPTVPEFASFTVALAILLTTPAFAYLIVKKQH